eukprot:2081103-Rhodomonas_salina.4
MPLGHLGRRDLHAREARLAKAGVSGGAYCRVEEEEGVLVQGEPPRGRGDQRRCSVLGAGSAAAQDDADRNVVDK